MLIKTKDKWIKVSKEDCACNPREQDRLTKMYCWHRRYELGDKNPYPTPHDFLNSEEFKNSALTMDVFLLDHSGLAMSTSPFNDPWDSGQVGFISISKENLNKLTLSDSLETMLQEEVKEYHHYLNNNAFKLELFDSDYELIEEVNNILAYDCKDVLNKYQQSINDNEIKELIDIAKQKLENENFEGDNMEKIRAIFKQPNQPAEVIMLENDYHELSSRCEGLIDMTPLPTDENIDIVCNDEFLYNGMEPNIVIPEREGVMCGPLLFVGYNEEDGSSISLTDKQVETAMAYIERNQVHHMSLEGAFRYALVIKDFQEAEDAMKQSQLAQEME